MVYWGKLLLAFVIAAFIVLVELIASKYPRTFFLVKKSKALYAYAFIYGAISLLVMRVGDQLGIKIEGLTGSWWQPIVIGVSIKAFLHLRLFTVTIGTQSYPVGVESFVQLFEPWLLRTIDLEHDNAIRVFIKDRAERYRNLDQVKETIKTYLPNFLPQKDKETFLGDLESKSTVHSAMASCLVTFGKAWFNLTFPAR